MTRKNKFYWLLLKSEGHDFLTMTRLKLKGLCELNRSCHDRRDATNKVVSDFRADNLDLTVFHITLSIN